MSERFAVEEGRDGLATVELRDREADSFVAVVPSRGAIATRFSVRGRELFYLDRETLLDETKNVRGGSPVLFPSPGKLAGDAWSWGGRQGSMKQHGFARTRPWTVGARGTDEAARVTLELTSSDTTRRQFGWDFALAMTLSLRDGTLGIDVTVDNRSGEAMPFGFGLHPYFAVRQADKAATRIPSDATRAWDNAARRDVDFTGFDLTLPEVDLHLADHRSPAIALVLADGAQIELSGSPEVRRWVVWTLAGKDFVCLEPWTCPGDALNRGEDLLVVPPAQRRSLRVQMRFLPPGT